MKKLFLLASLLMAFGISADAGDITSPYGHSPFKTSRLGTGISHSSWLAFLRELIAQSYSIVIDTETNILSL